MIALTMWIVQCAILFILFNRNPNLVTCEILHVCSHSSQHNISCLALSQFAINQKAYAEPNVTLIFDGGNHTLATGFVMSNVKAFSMLSESENSGAVVINCREGANMKFSNISAVYIRGLTFIGCGGNTVHFVRLFNIEHSEFHGKNNSETSIIINASNASITGTNFTSNVNGRYRSDYDIDYFRLIHSMDSFSASVGGALIVAHSTVIIDICWFEGNAANVGAVIYSEFGSNVTISESNFFSNSASGCNHFQSCFGGALFVEGGSAVEICKSIFYNNTSDEDGGAAYIFNATLIISRSTVSDNTANNDGGAISAYLSDYFEVGTTIFIRNKAKNNGGAMSLRAINNSKVVDDCIFTNNSAYQSGGAIFNTQGIILINSSLFTFTFAALNGGILANHFGQAFIFNSIFLHNLAQNWGGVLYAAASSTILIQNCSLHDNLANKGGVIYATRQTNIDVNNSTFYSNNFNITTGAVIYAYDTTAIRLSNIHFFNNSADCGGTLTAIKNNYVLIENCTFSNNMALRNGGAIYASTRCTFTIINSTFIENRAINDAGTVYIFDHSNMMAEKITFIGNIAGHDGSAVFTYNGCIILFQSCIFYNNSADKAGGVIYGRSSSTIIMNNSVLKNNSAQTLGGGIRVIQNCHIIVEASNFTNNTANYGGVLTAVKNSSILIDNCILASNIARGNGGVVHVRTNCTVAINGSNFHANRAADDGVVLVSDGSNMKAENSIFTENFAGHSGGAIHVYDDSNIFVNYCKFNKNRADSIGGVIYGRSSSTITIKDSTIKNNSAQTLGGGIHASQNCHIIVNASNFTSNTASYGGVLTATKNSSILIDNCLLASNKARGNGGVVYTRTNCTIVVNGSNFDANRAADDGTVLVSDGSNITAENSTFTENFAGHDGGVIHVYDDSNIFVNYCKFNNNRADNSGGAIYARNNGSIMLNITSMNNNSAQTSGGGIHAQKECDIVIEFSNFTKNTADYGGVVYAYVCTTIEILVSSFVENWANIAGGALATYENSSIAVESCNFTSNFAGAGGVAVVFQSTYKCMYQFYHHSQFFKTSMLAFNKSMFLYNRADENGVLYAQGSIINVANSGFNGNNATIQGGAICATSTSIVDIYATNFVDNKAYKGGVIALSNSSVNVKYSNFTRGRARDNGGVIFLQWSAANIHTSMFISSISCKSGGVLAVINSSVKIESSSFDNNSVNQSGGVLYVSSKSNLTIMCSVFVNNTAVLSGGVIHQMEASNCTVINCILLLNKASHNGGVISMSSSFVSMISSSLIQNSANNHGAALMAERGSHIVFEANMLACRCDTNGSTTSLFLAENNLTELIGKANKIDNALCTLDTYIGYSKATFGGGIYAVKSSITFGSSVHFHENYAKGNGGGINLKNSKFYSTNKAAAITFESNRADMYGGGIYIEDKTNNSICANDPVFRQSNKNSGCFFQSATKHLTIIFVKNQAFRGHDLFGGLLDRCTALSDIDARPFELKPSGTSKFKAISNLMNYDTVSSLPMRLCLCNKNHNNSMEPDCSQREHKVNIKIKNDFSFHIAAVDQVNHTVPATIISKFEDADLTDSQERKRIIGLECYELKYRVAFPNVSTYKLYMYPDGPCADKGISRLSISVNVISCTCPPGFMQEDIDTNCACVCDKFISKYIKRCNQSNKTVKRKGTFWIMYLKRSTDNAKNVSPYFIYPYCPLNYCQSPSTPIHINFSQPNGSDAQCVNNRGGFLCGGCLPQYSLSFGSSRCIKCPKHWYGLPVGILLGTLFAGLMLVFLILVLNLTVAVGTLNALIFYANIIDANKSTYFSQESRIKFFPMFISWLNLNIGFDMCFFEGMDLYAKVWLELAFPIYIILLVILIIYVSSRSSKLSKILGKRNPVATLATLILVSYTKLLEIIVVSFSFVRLKFSNGTVVTKWLPDASVGFNPWKHCALILMGLLVLIFGLLYTALVLFWQLLLHCPRNSLFRFTRNQELQSFVEAYHIPYNAKYRYWTGLLLLIRILVDLISTFTASADPCIALLATAVVMSSLLLYKTLLTVKVYKNRLLSAIESFTLINIAIFAMFTWYAFDNTDDQAKDNLQMSVAYTSVGIIFILFLLVFIFHAYRYGNSKVYSLVRNLRLMKKLNEKIIQCDSWTTSHGSSAYNYNLFDLIDNRETDEYTPPPVKLQQEVSRSVVSVATSECQVAESDFAENQVEKN